MRTIPSRLRPSGILDAAMPRLPGPFRKAARRFRMRRMIDRIAQAPQPPVLVYTASKVASTAVTEALQAVEGQHVLQVHFISPDNVRDLGKRMRQRGMVPDEAAGIAELADALYAKLIKPRHRVRIVSLVREPVARNLSSYFQVLDVLWQVEQAHEKIELDRLIAEFHDRFPHERGIVWFDKEFKPVLGIDVYSYPFPREKGYLRIDSGPYEILLMRHDLDDRLKETCLAELVGIPVAIAPKNVGAQKDYSKTYREFLNRVSLTADYVDPLLNSKYARHFFTPEELAHARGKWLGSGPHRTTADNG